MKKTSSSSASLRVGGDDLIPSEITELFNCEPTQAQTRGQTFTSNKPDYKRVAKFGLWQLSAKDCEPMNLDSQIVEIFQQLPRDLEIWKQLNARFELDIFCGLFMSKSNDVVAIAPEPMQLLSSRGVALKLDIYNKIE